MSNAKSILSFREIMGFHGFETTDSFTLSQDAFERELISKGLLRRFLRDAEDSSQLTRPVRTSESLQQ